MADSVILATAGEHSATLWTQDSHLEGITGVRCKQSPGRYPHTEEMTKFVELSTYWIEEGMKLLNNKRKSDYHSIINLLEEEYDNFKCKMGDLERDYYTIIGKRYRKSLR